MSYRKPPAPEKGPQGPPDRIIVDQEVDTEHGLWRVSEGVAARTRPIGSHTWPPQWVIYDKAYILHLYEVLQGKLHET